MVYLTITLDEEILERARSKASEEGTSVDALLRSYVEAYAGPTREDCERAVKALLDLARTASSGSGGRRLPRSLSAEQEAALERILSQHHHLGGQAPSRDELHEC
jgi:hypothetical protein